MPIISTAKMTAQQFLQLGEDPPGVRLELVDGEIAVSPSPTPDHSYVIMQLSALLVQHVRTRALGRVYSDVDTVLAKYLVRRPDILYFSKARVHLIGKKAMEGAPDLCVEIVSPSSGEIDRTDKFAQYETAGVMFYWIIDPAEKSFEAYTLIDGGFRATVSGRGEAIIKAAPFEDLEIPLGELWQPH